MKYSNYNFLFESSKYGYLLYNSLSNSFMEIDEILYKQLLDKNIDEIDEDIKTELKKAKVLVTENEEKDILLEQKSTSFINKFDQLTLGLAIAPTLACNFNCVYCFEHNKVQTSMKDKTIDKVIEFIKSYKTVKSVEITWYGGEPLLGLKAITKLIDKIKQENIEISRQGMVTNGYLMTDENLATLKNMNMDFIQFTLDGLPETHNKRRLHKNPNIKTYDIIIKNIEKFINACPSTEALIRIHIDKDTKHEFPVLYKELKQRWKDKNVSVYPAFLRDDINSCSSSCNAFGNQKDMFNFYYELYKKHNIDVNFFPRRHIGGCTATNLCSFVLGPEGELYKCWNDIGIEERVVGNIHTNQLSNRTILWKYLMEANKFEDESCKECLLFPICSGGCPYYRVEGKLEGKDNYPMVCSLSKPFLKEFLEIHYEQRQKAKVTIE